METLYELCTWFLEALVYIILTVITISSLLIMIQGIRQHPINKKYVIIGGIIFSIIAINAIYWGIYFLIEGDLIINI
ncbi:hypothetical protein KL86DYS2_11629 [uncultured Dysgonomonas sp.]|uniref:Uncharacterized protein n=1 Tax=uncultured Dysgonomonas sp. TaxID=206096 RepID=A0A212JIR9_9BACT|nr:hypothetical protein KL86DYS2_11629 [uncultured Dysgonomonas sp.]